MMTDCERILSRDKEDELKIARCSQSYIERFFVKSDAALHQMVQGAVAGQKTPQDVVILMNSSVNRSNDYDGYQLITFGGELKSNRLVVDCIGI
jgi:hypothetical protein